MLLSDPIVGNWRSQVCKDAIGVVLDLGFGSGRNLDHYGSAVTEVLAIDPSDSGWKLAQKRIANVSYPVRRAGTDAQDVDLPDSCADTVTSAWTLCTIPDPVVALAEARRVLRPGGQLRFVEHSLAQTPRIQKIQHTIQPAWGSIAGGCHLNRNILELLTQTGFKITEKTTKYAIGFPPARPWSWFVTGIAVNLK